jgi:hypothetical protein
MPGRSCPITCTCRRAGDGAFILAGCAFAAARAPLFLGDGDFGTLLIAFVREPLAPPFALAVWAGIAAVGVVLLGMGLYAALVEQDDVPVRPWLVVVPLSALALWRGWLLPSDWGPVFELGSEGFYIGVISAGLVNVTLALRGSIWQAGYFAGRRGDDPRRVQALVAHLNATIERLTDKCDRLTNDLARASSPARDLEAVFKIPGVLPVVRRTALAVLHPDHGKTEAEKRARTVQFQKTAAMLDRLADG